MCTTIPDKGLKEGKGRGKGRKATQFRYNYMIEALEKSESETSHPTQFRYNIGE